MRLFRKKKNKILRLSVFEIVITNDEFDSLVCSNVYTKEFIALTTDEHPKFTFSFIVTEMRNLAKQGHHFVINAYFDKNNIELKKIKIIKDRNGIIPRITKRKVERSLKLERRITHNNNMRLENDYDTWLLFRQPIKGTHSNENKSFEICKGTIAKLDRNKNGLQVHITLRDGRSGNILISRNNLKGGIHRELKKVEGRKLDFDVEIYHNSITAIKLSKRVQAFTLEKKEDYSNPFS